MNRLFAAALMASVAFPAFAADTTVQAGELITLNEIINQTNFVVAKQCSGTLISLKYKLVITNNHCLEGYVDKVTKNEEGPDGTFEDKTREVFKDMELSQESYNGFDKTGESTLQAKILFHSQKFDLALLKIKADTIPQTLYSHVLPEDEKVSRGDKVYVVGNPFLLESNLTEGVISSTTRTLQWDDPAGGTVDVHYYGVDAGINPGNSGGAAYDVNLNFIGIPAAKISSATGVGFIIPAESVRAFLADHCYADVYDDKAKTFDECMQAKFDKANDARAKAGKPTLDKPKSWDEQTSLHGEGWGGLSGHVATLEIKPTGGSIRPPVPAVKPVDSPTPPPPSARPITGLLADWVDSLFYAK